MDPRFMLPVGNVGAINPYMLPVANVGALRSPFRGRQDRTANRQIENNYQADNDRQREFNRRLAAAMQNQQANMFEQAQQAQMMQQLAQQQQALQAVNSYNVASNPGVMPISSPYAANIPGGNPFSPSPAAPPVSPPANARPVPLGNASAVQMAALSGGTPGTATLTFTSQDPFWLFDLSIECESDNLAYVESLTLGSQNIRAGSSGIQSVKYWSCNSFNQGKLQGYFINSTQSLVVVVRNVSTSTNWCFGSASGASVR